MKIICIHSNNYCSNFASSVEVHFIQMPHAPMGRKDGVNVVYLISSF